jgi:hypothetical protein
VLATAALATLACLACASSRATDEKPGVLRARGIVVEDEQGRARILIGAPIPSGNGRKRTDPASGLVFLGPDGADRVQLGDVGGPQMGGKINPRQSAATGLMVNDVDGDERGGFGVFANGQVGFGLDYPSQREAIVAAVMPDKGFAGIVVCADTDADPMRAMLLTSRDGQTALKMSDTKGTDRAVWSASGTSAPTFQLLDEKGALVRDVFARP